MYITNREKQILFCATELWSALLFPHVVRTPVMNLRSCHCKEFDLDEVGPLWLG